MEIWETSEFPFMVPKQVPIHTYFSEPQNYNPDLVKVMYGCAVLSLATTMVGFPAVFQI